MIDDVIIIDNCLDNINYFRNEALLLNYTQSEPDSKGWRGYRCLSQTNLADELFTSLTNKLIERNPIFSNTNSKYHFHYSLESTQLDNKIHKDFNSDYAGVFYLSPNPSPNSGTLLFDDNASVINDVTNIYNRLIAYPSNIWHSLNNSFGTNIVDGRLVFVIFYSLIQKESKTII